MYSGSEPRQFSHSLKSDAPVQEIGIPSEAAHPVNPQFSAQSNLSDSLENAAKYPTALLRICLIWSLLHRKVILPKPCKGVVTEEKIQLWQKTGDISDILNSVEDSMTEDLEAKDDMGMSEAGDAMEELIRKHNEHIYRERRRRFNMQYTTRSISVLGALGGIVLILLIMALSSCIKHRRNIYMDGTSAAEERSSFARQVLIYHLRRNGGLNAELDRGRERRGSSDSATSSQVAAAAVEPPPIYDVAAKPPEFHEVVVGEEAMEMTSDEPPSYIEAVAERLADSVVIQTGEGSEGERDEETSSTSTTSNREEMEEDRRSI